MFIHLGGSVVVSQGDIIAIFDVDTSGASVNTKNFLKMSEDDGFVVKISEDEPKSFVLTEKRKKTIIYLSPISSTTLFKRAKFMDDISISK